MHRLSLILPNVQCLLDINTTEVKIFEKLCNSRDLNEMDMFLNILKTNSEMHGDMCGDKVNDLLINAKKFLNTDDEKVFKTSLNALNYLIFRAPSNSEGFIQALYLRGLCFLRQGYITKATNDFLMYLNNVSGHQATEELYKQPCKMEALFRAHGLLATCFYLKQSVDEAQEHFLKFNTYKSKLNPEVIEELKNDLLSDKTIQLIFIHVDKFKSEITHNNTFECKLTKHNLNYVPYGGFNRSNELPLCSSSCQFKGLGDGHKPRGVLTSKEIPNGEVVIVENPLLFSCRMPFTHCEQCLAFKAPMYTCLNCRYKTYCSVNCLELDMNEHKEECLGYKYLVLPMLDATRVFRLFMRIISFLAQERFDSSGELRKLRRHSKDIFDYIIKRIKEGIETASSFMAFLTTKPSYDDLTTSQFVTLVTYTFRLTVFVCKMSKVNEMFFSKFQLSKRQNMILIGALLLRLNCHIILNSIETELYIHFRQQTNLRQMEEGFQKSYNTQTDVSQRIRQRVYSYYNFNTVTEFSKIYSQFGNKGQNEQRTLRCSENDLPEFLRGNPNLKLMDTIAEMCLNSEDSNIFLNDKGKSVNISQLIANSSSARIEFLTKFTQCFRKHLNDYFNQSKINEDSVNQGFSVLCSTLIHFRHSCNSNVELIHLNNGVILGKSLRNIYPKEELTINYSSNFMQYPKNIRKKFLNMNGIYCNCSVCSMPKEVDPSNLRLAIFCSNCVKSLTEITPLPGKCSNCNLEYHKQLLSYKVFINSIEEDIKKKENSDTNERELTILYDAYFQYVSKHFTEYHELRIRVELKYAKFLATKCFLKQACELILLVKSHLKYYDEKLIWCDIYADMLEIIKIILHNVIDYVPHLPLEGNYLNKLCTMGLFILGGQERYLKRHCAEDKDILAIYKDLKIFHEWKDKISAFVLLSARLIY